LKAARVSIYASSRGGKKRERKKVGEKRQVAVVDVAKRVSSRMNHGAHAGLLLLNYTLIHSPTTLEAVRRDSNC